MTQVRLSHMGKIALEDLDTANSKTRMALFLRHVRDGKMFISGDRVTSSITMRAHLDDSYIEEFTAAWIARWVAIGRHPILDYKNHCEFVGYEEDAPEESS